MQTVIEIIGKHPTTLLGKDSLFIFLGDIEKLVSPPGRRWIRSRSIEAAAPPSSQLEPVPVPLELSVPSAYPLHTRNGVPVGCILFTGAVHIPVV